MASFQRTLEAFVNLPVASMNSDASCLDQLRVQTTSDAAVVGGAIAQICHKTVAAFRLGLYDVVGSLIAVLHDACKMDATAVALCLADGRRAAKASMTSRGGSNVIDPIAVLVDLFLKLDDLATTSARSAAAQISTGQHVSGARGDLVEAIQLLSAEEAVKLDLGVGLADALVRLLVRSVDYNGPVGTSHGSIARARSKGESQSDRVSNERRRALLAEHELYRAAAGALINLIQHCKPNKDLILGSLSSLLCVLEASEDYSVQVMCLEVLFRLHFHNPAACRDVIASTSSSSYLNDSLRNLQSPSQKELLRTLEHMTQLIVTKRVDDQAKKSAAAGGAATGTTLHLDAVGVELMAIPNASSSNGTAGGAPEEVCTLSGPTMLHFNISFMVFRMIDNVSHVTIPYTDVRSVRISRANKILISLHRTPDVIAELLLQQKKEDVLVSGGSVGVQVCVTAARVAQLRQSSLLDWIAAAKSSTSFSSASPAVVMNVIGPPATNEATADARDTAGKRMGSTKRPRSNSNVATVEDPQSAPPHSPRPPRQHQQVEPHDPHPLSRSEQVVDELRMRVQALVDAYRADMSERRERLETSQRRAVEDFLAHLKHIRHEARQRVDYINDRMESLQTTWEAVRDQELPKLLHHTTDAYEEDLKAVEVARVKELKVKVDASLGHVSDAMNRLVDQGELYMLQRMRQGSSQ